MAFDLVLNEWIRLKNRGVVMPFQVTGGVNYYLFWLIRGRGAMGKQL